MSKTANMTTKDMINARTASVQLKAAPEHFKATGLAISQDLDKETGEMREVGYIAADNGDVYGTISNTALCTIDEIIKAVEEGEIELPCELGVRLRKSNAGREFITLTLL